jgi:crossover junction endodeoxyribonuclease RuvC
VAGHGLARKELVQEMAMRLLALPGKDGADALGLAITHVHAGRSFMALTQSATLQRRSHAQYRRGRTY